MRTVLLLALVACGADPAPDPHALETCEHEWSAGVPAADTQCEAVCNVNPATLSSGPCGVQACSHLAEIDGVAGCCEGGLTIRWRACE